MADRSVTVALHSTGITGYTSEVATASRETLAYDRAMRAAGKAADSYTRAVAAAGAESNRAVAAQAKYTDSLKRVAIAENDVAAAAARASEAQVRASERAAAAGEAAAAKQAAATKKIGTVAGGIGLVAAAGLGLAAKAASDFNAKMAQVQSLTRGSADQVAALSAATKNYAGIGISASQAADAEIELVKAGVSVKDILGGALTGTLNAAAAGQIDVAQATEIASAAMVQFGLSGQAIPHVADLLAAGADKSLGGIGDLGEGLKAVGTTAHQFGLSIDETVGALSEFAAAGLTGSLGGTALKQALLKLEAPSAKAAAVMDQYGISLYDASGKQVTLANLAGQLKSSLSGVSAESRSAALATIFGSRAVQVANVLYKDGAAGVNEWTNKVNDSGFAAQQAKGKMDSLQGDLQKLGAEVSNAAVSFGQQLQPVLRAVTQDLTTFVGFLDHIPGPLKEAAALTLVFTAAVGLGTFAYTRAAAGLGSMAATLGLVGKQSVTATTGLEATSVAATGASRGMLAARGGAAALGIGLMTLSSRAGSGQKALGVLSQAAAGAALGFSVTGGPWGAAIGGGVGLLTGLVSATHSASDAQAQLKSQADALAASMMTATGAIKQNMIATLENSLSTRGAYDDAAKLGIGFDTVAQAAMGNAAALDQVKTAGILAVKGNGDLFGSYADLLNIIDAQNTAFDDNRRHLLQVQTAQQTAAGAAARLATAQGATNKVFGQLDLAGVASETQKVATSTGQAAVSTGVLKAQQDALKASTEKLTLAQQQLNSAYATRVGGLAGLTLEIESATSSMKGLGNASKDGGRAIDYQSHAGATLVQNLIGIAETASKVTGSAKTQAASINHARDAMIKLAEAHGVGAAAAEKQVNALLDSASAADVARGDMKALIQQYDLTPKEVKTAIAAEGATTAAGEVKALRDYIAQLHDKSVTITYNLAQTGSAPGRVVYDDVPAKATGGRIYGKGTGTSDSNLIRASRDEFMVKEKSAKSIGYQALNYMNATGSLPPGHASGGRIGTPPRGFAPSGGSRTVYMTDPALVAEVRALRRELGTTQQKVHVVNAGEVAGGVAGVANGAVQQYAAHLAYEGRRS